MVADSSINQPQVPECKVDFELGRLATFDDRWPHPENSRLSKTTMAQAGFFYSGRDDMVTCFECGVRLQGWDSDEDNPWEKHNKGCLFGSLGKKEGDLKLFELLNVFESKAIHRINSRIDQLSKCIR